MKRLIAMVLLTWSSLALAGEGGIVGNGGDVVYCPANEERSSETAELLDHYESRVIRDWQLSLGAGGTALERVKLVLDRLKRLDPVRAALLQVWADEFEAKAQHIAGIELVDVPDSDHQLVPVGCSIRQLVIQRTPHVPDEPRYIISEDLWQLLGDDGKAGAILHELIYREAIAAGQQNSINARYYNGMISSTKIETMTLESYRNTTISLSLPLEDIIVWQDNESGRSWFLVQGTNASMGDATCVLFGAHAPTIAEIGAAYPGLGEALDRAGVFATTRGVFVRLRQSELAVLAADGVSIWNRPIPAPKTASICIN